MISPEKAEIAASAYRCFSHCTLKDSKPRPNSDTSQRCSQAFDFHSASTGTLKFPRVSAKAGDSHMLLIVPPSCHA